jgi:hypothetical protein
VVDIGIFIVVLQFFAAMATVEGEDRVLFQGLVLCFCFGFFYWVRWGIYYSGCWFVALLLDSFVPGLRRWMTTQMAKLNCCRAVGVEQQGDAI